MSCIKPVSINYLLLIFELICLVDAMAAEQQMEEITVWGRALELVGEADSASHGIVGYADFSTRPLMRVGELVEVVPGMIATQHSGPGKANQYFLRGMNLDHGSDFSAYVDGMPVSMRSHAHASGYLDLNILIPEIIETVEFRKGPYYVEKGDFSAAGGAKFRIYDRLERGFVRLEVGDQDDYRFVAANSQSVNGGDLLYAGEFFVRDGPWDLEQDLKKFNVLLKYSFNWAGFDSTLQLMAYDAEWTSTNQVPLRAVENSLISRFGFIDPDLGGSSSRYSLLVNMANENLDIGAYLSRYAMNLFNNPTYLLNDPVNGDEFEQEDERWLYGLHINYENEREVGRFVLSPHLGMELRYDDIGEVNLFTTIRRRRINALREDSVEQFSIGLFGDIEIQLTEKLRASAGLRWDYYDFDVAALTRANSGSGDDSLLQPKLSLAYSLIPELEFYANYGIGFHSNDVRGAVLTIDPVSGLPVEPVDVLVEAEGAELGARYESSNGLVLTLVGFWMELDSELLFVGDAGTSEPNEATKRHGLEFSAFWNINDWLTLDASYTRTRAEFHNLPDGQNAIPDAHGQTASAGATIVTDNGWIASLRMRHFGDAALVGDESVKKDDSTLFNFGLSRRFGDFELGLDVLNLLDAKDDDVAYLFESRLPGETGAVEDIHFHPVEERAFKLSLTYRF